MASDQSPDSISLERIASDDPVCRLQKTKSFAKTKADGDISAFHETTALSFQHGRSLFTEITSLLTVAAAAAAAVYQRLVPC